MVVFFKSFIKMNFEEIYFEGCWIIILEIGIYVVEL